MWIAVSMSSGNQSWSFNGSMWLKVYKNVKCLNFFSSIVLSIQHWDTDHWGGSRCCGECCICGEGDLSATVSRPGTAPPGSGSPGPWSPHWPPSPSPPCLCLMWASFGANIQITQERGITSDTLRWVSSASLCLLLTDCCCCCRCCDPQSRCWPSCGALVTETGSGPQPVSCVPPCPRLVRVRRKTGNLAPSHH